MENKISKSSSQETSFENSIENFTKGMTQVFENINEKSNKRLNFYKELSPEKKFNSWVRNDTWILQAEAIPLLLGHSPDYVELLTKHKKYQKTSADKLYNIALSCIGEGLSLAVTNIKEPKEKWRVKRPDFIKWAQTKKIGISKELLAVNKQANPMEFSTTKSFSYSTKLIDIAFYVINEFWEGQDPKKAPSREWIIEHIQSKFELTGNQAKAIETVIRHESRQK